MQSANRFRKPSNLTLSPISLYQMSQVKNKSCMEIAVAWRAVRCGSGENDDEANSALL
jgi:hypothetical protein